MGSSKFMTPGAWLLCGILLLLGGGMYLLLSLAPQGRTAVVERDGEVVLRQDLSQLTEETTYTIQGADGVELTITLSPTGAEVSSSTCPDQVCVRTGRLTRAGESAICLPAKVSLRLEGGGDSVDATVY
ncbi:MAG: NusG domain II-containing protein [Acutalibacter sp.]|jgi:hypothetical protein